MGSVIKTLVLELVWLACALRDRALAIICLSMLELPIKRVAYPVSIDSLALIFMYHAGQ